MATPKRLPDLVAARLRQIQPGAGLLRSLWHHRQLVWRFAYVQMRERYASTMLGSAWAVVQPVSVILVYSFVFAYGLGRSSANQEVPFVLYLITGVVIWLAFADAIATAATAVTRSAFLVKKVAFPLEVLPAVAVVAAMVAHVAALACALAVCWLSGIPPAWGLLLLPYYAASAALLATGIGYLVAALNVFHRDVSEGVGLWLQLWFWLTPVVWSLDVFPPALRQVLELNPMAYVVTGYRQALLGSAAPGMAAFAVFWGVTLLLLLLEIGRAHV
jgi:ABC-type polysaccharide/polyol phosphate export permease